MAKSFFGTLYCPRCGSKDVEIAGTGKSYSVGKGVLGMALIGPVGAVAGIDGKMDKSTCHCKKCGKIWKERI